MRTALDFVQKLEIDMMSYCHVMCNNPRWDEASGCCWTPSPSLQGPGTPEGQDNTCTICFQSKSSDCWSYQMEISHHIAMYCLLPQEWLESCCAGIFEQVHPLWGTPCLWPLGGGIDQVLTRVTIVLGGFWPPANLSEWWQEWPMFERLLTSKHLSAQVSLAWRLLLSCHWRHWRFPWSGQSCHPSGVYILIRWNCTLVLQVEEVEGQVVIKADKRDLLRGRRAPAVLQVSGKKTKRHKRQKGQKRQKDKMTKR